MFGLLLIVDMTPSLPIQDQALVLLKRKALTPRKVPNHRVLVSFSLGIFHVSCRLTYALTWVDTIDDDAIVEFFKDCGGEMTGLRWLTHKDSGDFRGCGYIEFENTETADKAILKDGEVLLGRYLLIILKDCKLNRPIRIDWA